MNKYYTATFAMTYFGSVFGECSTCDASGRAAFSHPSIPTLDDGTVPYAAEIGPDGAWLNDALPEDIWYQLVGYCKVHGIPLAD